MAKTDEKKDGLDGEVLRLPAEQIFAAQLEALKQNDKDTPPDSWRLSPRSVLAYVLGGKALDATIGGKKKKVEITRKFFGETAIVERAIVTLASDRALLLIGDPGTGKSWLSEHLAAAICGNSTLVIQGTAGTTEEHIKYSWNIARVIAEGPNPIEHQLPQFLPAFGRLRAVYFDRFKPHLRVGEQIRRVHHRAGDRLPLLMRGVATAQAGWQVQAPPVPEPIGVDSDRIRLTRA